MNSMAFWAIVFKVWKSFYSRKSPTPWCEYFVARNVFDIPLHI